MVQNRRYRTVFLSDIHLGSRGSRARELASLLKRIRCDQLILIGDILDLWRLKGRWYWPPAHNKVVRRILKLAERGTRVVYIPGNHDDAVRQFIGLSFGGVEIEAWMAYTSVTGQRFLITHGDQFDLVVSHQRWLSSFGSLAYDWLVVFNRVVNRARQFFGRPYVSLSQKIKHKVKKACTYISRFEESLIAEAKRKGYDGVICGHIHKGEHDESCEGLTYINCGDWVESCSLVVEHLDGQLELLNGLELLAELKGPEVEELEPDPDDELTEIIMNPTEFFKHYTPPHANGMSGEQQLEAS